MQKAKNLQRLHKGAGSRNVQTPRAAESEAQGSRLQAEFVRDLCLERLLHRVLPLQSRSGWGKGAKGLGRWEPRGEAGTAGDPGNPQCLRHASRRVTDPPAAGTHGRAWGVSGHPAGGAGAGPAFPRHSLGSGS